MQPLSNRNNEKVKLQGPTCQRETSVFHWIWQVENVKKILWLKNMDRILKFERKTMVLVSKSLNLLVQKIAAYVYKPRPWKNFSRNWIPIVENVLSN